MQSTVGTESDIDGLIFFVDVQHTAFIQEDHFH